MCVSTNPEITGRGPVEVGGLSGGPNSAKVEFSDWGTELYSPSDGRDIEVDVEKGACLLSTVVHRVH
jgi:hypothetical protein